MAKGGVTTSVSAGIVSGVDTSQHVFHTGSRVLAHARGKLMAAL